MGFTPTTISLLDKDNAAFDVVGFLNGSSDFVPQYTGPSQESSSVNAFTINDTSERTAAEINLSRSHPAAEVEAGNSLAQQSRLRAVRRMIWLWAMAGELRQTARIQRGIQRRRLRLAAALAGPERPADIAEAAWLMFSALDEGLEILAEED